MREIKFRAWDKRDWQSQNHKMIFINGLDFPGDINDGYILMLYTGLKDKNGEEIYEGDILSPNDRTVQWIETGEGAMGVGFYTIAHSTEYPHTPFTFGITQAEGSKVIGNIWENKEPLDDYEN